MNSILNETRPTAAESPAIDYSGVLLMAGDSAGTKSELGDKIRLQHILDAMDEIHKYILGADLPVFLEGSMMRYTCIQQMEIIGEAFSQPPLSTRT